MESITIFWGSSVASAVFVQVTPLVLPSYPSTSPPEVSNFHVKRVLQERTRQSFLSIRDNSGRITIEWCQDHKTGEGSEKLNRNGLASGYLFHRTNSEVLQASWAEGGPSFPVFYLPSSNPTQMDPVPCQVMIFARPCSAVNVMVTDASLVRILPPRLANTLALIENDPTNVPPLPSWWTRENFLQALNGEVGHDVLSTEMQAQVKGNHNPETIRELTLHMTTLISHPIHVGTTADALQWKKQSNQQTMLMQQAIQSHCKAHDIPLQSPTSEISDQNKPSPGGRSGSLPWHPSLLVHSPNHADGKTLLVQAIARDIGCSRIHMVRPGQLLAKYGVRADAALETLIHSIVLTAAVHDEKICIILDHVDAMMPPQLSGRSSAGDAAVPVFNAIASYLRNITSSLQRHFELPFPQQNPLYNHAGSSGRSLSARLCLVGIATCPDDGWRSSQKDGIAGVSTIFDSMIGSRYRLTPLTASTRLKALKLALQTAGLHLSDAALAALPAAAASAVWAKGSAFSRITKQLCQDSGSRNGSNLISDADLERAMLRVKNDSAEGFQVSFQSQQGAQHAEQSLFESVGGNVKAKQSLEDALALDPHKRQMLGRFGLSPPTGILLYGPPGCGKTLLAKAVARLLKSPKVSDNDSSVPMGGTFISLGSADLVRAEVGTSEKMLVSAFNFADKNAPSVVFLDEFQALFTERSRGGSGRLATALLQCLDDIKRWRHVDDSTRPNGGDQTTADLNRVVVLGATNTPWMVDSAFLRPGRFDRVVHVGLPTMRERESILMVHTKSMRIGVAEDGESNSYYLKDLCRRIAEQTNGFSGADLASLCRAAACRALLESDRDHEINESHFMVALENDINASSDKALVERLLKWRQ